MEEKVIDLCNMSSDYTKRLNEIYIQYSLEYSNFIDTLSDTHKDSIYWWSTHLSSRNLFLSDTYRYLCIVLLGIELCNEKKELKEIIVTDWNIGNTLKKYFRCHKIPVDVRVKSVSKVNTCSEIGKACFNFYFVLWEEFKRRNLIRKNTTNEGKIINKDIVLIDTDVFSSCFASGEYQARDFANILDYTKENIYFVPYFYLNTQMTMEALVNLVISSPKYKFLLKERFLSISDYLKTMLFPFSSIWFCKGKKIFSDIDITDIVNADLLHGIPSRNSMEGVMNYCFIKRLKKKNIDIKTLIGWYEGQPSSNGLFMSFRKYYNEKKSIGYVGYPVDTKWLSLCPTKEQELQKSAPHTIGIISNAFEMIPRRFNPETDINLVPAFRLQHVFDIGSNHTVNNHKTLLIVLPYFTDVSRRLLEQIDIISGYLAENEVRVLIKNHPSNINFSMEDYGIEKIRFHYTFTNEDYSKAVRLANVIVTCASTAVYETVLSERFVIIVNLPGELCCTYLPKEWEHEWFEVVNDLGDLENAIGKYMNQEKRTIDISSEYYLMKTNEINVRKMM